MSCTLRRAVSDSPFDEMNAAHHSIISMRRAAGGCLACCALVASAGAWGGGAGPDAEARVDHPRQDADARATPAEERRFKASVFRAGLKKRGLTELLELHLADFPPKNAVSGLKLRRALKLAAARDPSRTRDERLAAVRDANRLLEALITEANDPWAQLSWRLELAQSLLYDEGEPYRTSILLRGGTDAERGALRALASRSLAMLLSLRDALLAQQTRLDTLSLAEFERLEQAGRVEGIDDLSVRVEYLLLWARFYDALARDEDDPVRAAALHTVHDALSSGSPFLASPNDALRVQTLLLAGMTCRLLNDHACARRHLERSLVVHRGIDDASLRRSLRWAWLLAWVERVRNERDRGRYADALGLLETFRSTPSGGSDDDGAAIVAVLLERSIHRARAAAADRARRAGDARRSRDDAWRCLANVAHRRPRLRDELYATVYDLIGPDAAPTSLDAFELAATVAGLLFDAGQTRSEPEAAALLERAVAIGETFLTGPGRDAETLRPEVLFNVATALYRLGRGVEASSRFLDVARRYHGFDHAERAATLAVEVADEAYRDPSLAGREVVRQRYMEALALLVTRYGQTDAARYWRFFYGQALDAEGRYDAAAVQYSLVDASHEHYVESVFLHARCLALVAERRAADRPEDVVAVRRRVDAFVDRQRSFATIASAALQRERDPARMRLIRSMIAEAEVIAAELQLMPQIDRPAHALQRLDGFEGEHAGASPLMGRVLKVRMIAYERLGRLDDATDAIPAYVEADPRHASATLQTLYTAMAASLRDGQDEPAASRKADAAVLVAETLRDLAGRDADPERQEGRYAFFEIQLAEAYLAAGRLDDARAMFERYVRETGADDGQGVRGDRRAVTGLAETCYQLGAYPRALRLFNGLAVSLSADDPLRWHALLRDLQCRTALGHAPAGIVKVIEQQRALYGALGGAALAAEFDRLERENRRRLDE
ncbi:MAG: hypothetical protein ACE5E6_00915 [Phycisphaerae bacterium]